MSDSNSTEDNFIKLKEMKDIEEVHLIYGDYDLILKVKLKNLHEMTNFMMKLRNNFDIKKSNTSHYQINTIITS